MKRFLLLAISLVLVTSSWSQAKSGDAELDKRLEAYIQANQVKDFESVMDYMHPKLFTIAPKKALISYMKSAFESKEMNITMEDMGITSAETSSFKSGGSEYRQVAYKMTTTISFTDTSVYTPAFIDQMTEAYQASFEGKSVTFDKDNRSFVVKGTDVLYAIKDQGKPWLFLGFKNDSDMIKKLFPKEVIDHYRMLN